MSKFTEETRRRMSLASKGKPKSATHRANISKGQKGKKVSEATKEKMRGRVVSKETREKQSRARKGLYTGDKNPMAGRSVYSVWLEKYGKEEADRRQKVTYDKMLKILRARPNPLKDRNSKGSANPMFGRTVYSVWVEKYGVEEADRRKAAMSLKQSQRQKGKDNPMYGRSPKHSAGAGLSGRYKNWFFRSTTELSYMIKVIERFNLPWENAEQGKWMVPYTDAKGTNRTYKSDFIIGGKYMVEIKPKALQEVDTVLEKKAAAEKFCESKGMIYRITSVPNLSSEILANLYYSGAITFGEKSEDKFLKYNKLEKRAA